MSMDSQNKTINIQRNPTWEDIMDAVAEIQGRGFTHNYSKYQGVHRVFFNRDSDPNEEIANGATDIDMKKCYTDAVGDFLRWYLKPKSKTPVQDAFKEIQGSIGKYWDKEKCVCNAIFRDPCDLNCPEHDDNK